MKCPRCKSKRLQRGFDEPALPLRLIGLRGVLCNNCGLEFRGFDPAGRLVRAKSGRKETRAQRRRAPRYSARLPANISLVEVNPKTRKVWHSQTVLGHCTNVSRFGLELSFSGAKFAEEDFARTGRLIQVTVTLPKGAVSALARTVRHRRADAGGGSPRWVVGAEFKEMAEGDKARLAEYLTGRAGAEEILF